MAKAKKRKKVSPKRKKIDLSASEESLILHADMARVKKHLEKLWENAEKVEEKIQDIEIHVNLLTRLLTTLCVEKFGMRIGVLKRLIKRIEKEAIRDSQILHLETLYKMPPPSDKKGHIHPPSSKNDPWEEIS
jgi:hypothetical protein